MVYEHVSVLRLRLQQSGCTAFAMLTAQQLQPSASAPGSKAACRRLLILLARFGSRLSLRLGQSRALYEGFQALKDRQWQDLSEAQRRIVDEQLRDFVHSGVALEARRRFVSCLQQTTRVHSKIVLPVYTYFRTAMSYVCLT